MYPFAPHCTPQYPEVFFRAWFCLINSFMKIQCFITNLLKMVPHGSLISEMLFVHAKLYKVHIVFVN